MAKTKKIKEAVSPELDVNTEAVELPDVLLELPVVEAIPEVTPEDRSGYLRNKDLLPAIREAKEKGFMTDKLARMLQMLCKRYGTHYKYNGYSYNDDMQSYAMIMLVRSWASFNPDRSNNPFAYYTQCIKNSFKQYLNYEKRNRVVRDELLLQQGQNPSHAYRGSERDSDDEIQFSDDYDYSTPVKTESYDVVPNNDAIMDDLLAPRMEPVVEDLPPEENTDEVA